MYDENKARLDKILQNVPNGSIRVKHIGNGKGSFPSPLIMETAGRGQMEIFQPMPGMNLALCLFIGSEVVFRHDPRPDALEVNHCSLGRCGWDMEGGVSVYLGAGDFSIHSMDCCADSHMSIPLEHYVGITVSIDLTQLEPSAMLLEAGVSADHLWQKFGAGKKPLALPVCAEIDQVFSVLYGIPEAMRPAYYTLKAQELLLFLTQLDPTGEQALNPYRSQQVEIIKEIHALLIGDLSRRFTVEELAKKYLLNTTTLKSIFKAVYGQPIAAYMKAYRVQQAARLLRESTDSIAEIAAAIGYESQGKFTAAFKDIFSVPPTIYRKQLQSQYTQQSASPY